MAEVRICLFRPNLSANHSVRGILLFDDLTLLHRLRETGPATSGIKLIQRAEKWFARDYIHVNSGLMIIPVFIAEGRFGAAFLRDPELFRSQFLQQGRLLWLLGILHIT